MNSNKSLIPFILLVDDEEDLLLLMKFKLQSEGFKVEISQNGKNILDILHQFPPDIILLDIRMKEVDGGTICHLLKTNKSTRHIPIFMFSANDNVNIIAQQCGADGFITKPFEVQKVKDLLMNIFTERDVHP